MGEANPLIVPAFAFLIVMAIFTRCAVERIENHVEAIVEATPTADAPVSGGE